MFSQQSFKKTWEYKLFQLLVVADTLFLEGNFFSIQI